MRSVKREAGPSPRSGPQTSAVGRPTSGLPREFPPLTERRESRQRRERRERRERRRLAPGTNAAHEHLDHRCCHRPATELSKRLSAGGRRRKRSGGRESRGQRHRGRERAARERRARPPARKHISIIDRCSTCATAPPLSSARGSAPAAADSSDLEAAKAEVSSGSRAPPPCRSNVCTHRQARERLDLAWSARHARASRSRASPHARILCARAAPSPMSWFSDRGLLFEATFLAATTTP